jgi:hypothetical protein
MLRKPCFLIEQQLEQDSLRSGAAETPRGSGSNARRSCVLLFYVVSIDLFAELEQQGHNLDRMKLYMDPQRRMNGPMTVVILVCFPPRRNYQVPLCGVVHGPVVQRGHGTIPRRPAAGRPGLLASGCCSESSS